MDSSPANYTKLRDSAIADCLDWLSFHRIWGQLGHNTLTAIATKLKLAQLEAEIEIYQQGTESLGLYILQWGTIEIYCTLENLRTHLRYHNAGESFGCEPLILKTTGNIHQTNAVTVSKSAIWLLEKSDFWKIREEYPDFAQVINQLLAADLNYVNQRLAEENQRIKGLQPYLCPLPENQQVIGNSKISQKLTQQIVNAAQDFKPVILQAPPGSGKNLVAGLIHASSGLKNYPFAVIDLAKLHRYGEQEIDTQVIWKVILLLERGTLLIENLQWLPQSERDRLTNYLQTGLVESKPSWVRLILASPEPIYLGEIATISIKLYTLAQRKLDIPDFADYFLTKIAQERDRQVPQLSPNDLRRLLSYNYPENIAELEDILKRAVIMTPPGQETIPEQVLWSVESPKNAFRVDLLEEIPHLRRFLLSNWWPKAFWLGMMFLFVPVVIMGLIGPQTRDSSITLNFFWAWWWPFYLLLFPVIGRLWCAVCPFMITAEWLRKLSLWLWPRQLRPWPTTWLNKWGAWLLWLGFVVIYLWEKLWDLPHHADLSTWLLLIITAGAVLFSLIYERRLWCRYLCPIGGMNGLFAKLAALELRSTQQVCGTRCQSFGCYKGGEATPVNFANPLPNEGQATEGCPLYSHPAQLPDNRDCVLCMTCLKACPNRSVQLNLRFPAADLLETHRGFAAEAALLLLLLGGIFMHHSEQILGWLGWENISLDEQHLLFSLPVALILLSIPFMATYLVHRLALLWDPQLPNYQTIIYAYLPLTLGVNLAYYLPAAITEAGQILLVAARTFGLSGDRLPTLTWSMDVAAFLQGLTLLGILVFSLFPLWKITQRPFTSNLPHLGLMLVLILICFQLLF